jgi:hypothetical protein
VEQRALEPRRASMWTAGWQPVGLLASIVVVACVFAPWAHLTITVGLLGLKPPPLAINGNDIGSTVGSIPIGWITLGVGVVGLFAVLARLAVVAAAAGVVGTVIAVVTIATIHSAKIGDDVTIQGQLVTALLDPRISPAWGVWAALLGSLVLAGASLWPFLGGHRPGRPSP